MSPGTAIRLGRVSNLPTIWSNVLAGAILCGLTDIDARLWLPLVAMSLAYTGGMYLNDAFDRDIDARERPERPIPAREVASRTVFIASFAQLAFMVLLMAFSAATYALSPTHTLMASLLLVAAIILYNVWHKGNPLSPVLMGICRVLVYLSVSLAVVKFPATEVFSGSLILLAWLIGLTYTAKQEQLGALEQLWPLALLGVPLLAGVFAAFESPIVCLPLLLLAALLAYALRCLVRRGPDDVARAVTSMIAGIALVDAVLIAPLASPVWVLLAIVACPLTLILQRLVPGT